MPTPPPAPGYPPGYGPYYPPQMGAYPPRPGTPGYPPGYPYPPFGANYGPYPTYSTVPAYPPAAPYLPAPPPRPKVSKTAEGFQRLNAAVLLAAIYFVILALQRTFEAATGVTDVPGVRGHATLSLQFFSYLMIGIEAVLVALAFAVGASAFMRLREGRGEFAPALTAPSRRAIQALGVSLMIPLVVGVLFWFYLNGLQRSMPGLGMGSDLGLARLFDQYRYAQSATALAQLGAAFLIVVGLNGAMAPYTALSSRASFKTFGTLFVLAAALNAALVLVLDFVVLAPPTTGALVEPAPLLGLLIAAPVIGGAALLKLRTYLVAAGQEAKRQFTAKKTDAAPAK